MARLAAWAANAGLPVARVEAEVGSGLNGLRAKVRRLLPAPAVIVVVAGHRDRLGRVNTELQRLPCPRTAAAWWYRTTLRSPATWCAT